MSDTDTVAFGELKNRSVATASQDPLDRISVRDYVFEAEIGAFQSERGVTQRLQASVVLEVSRHAAALDDDVDKVLSYDTIIEAIQAQLAVERINLLETFAERVAERVLADKRAIRTFIRIEKLDRIPGTLGVEIVRQQIVTDTRLHAVQNPEIQSEEDVRPGIIYLEAEVLTSAKLGNWLDAFAGLDEPVVICVGLHLSGRPTSASAAIQRRIDLLAIEQNAWKLAEADARCVVVDSRTELEWSLGQDQLTVWAPSKMVLDAVDGPMDVQPAELASWFATEFDAEVLVVSDPDADIDATLHAYVNRTSK
jgi:dihydroneopterin aldolase